jgi:hypothetical protein
MLEMVSSGWKESINKTKKLLRCNKFAKNFKENINPKFKATKIWENGTLKMDCGDWRKSRNKTLIEL